MSAPYTASETNLLEWLSKEDSSSLGECYGTNLWPLVGEGLAEIKATNDRPWHYARVSLTDKGWLKLKEIRQ